ncbi:hypothetical protein A2U01_0008871 [Trifolium medium]|uniref:Uncharacterized protein n=1 Tax=Trifolium medium TaxID=97028 RepID=A0A392MKH5_9FABA|nr:hypothetical protein [Trifolium medium]
MGDLWANDVQSNINGTKQLHRRIREGPSPYTRELRVAGAIVRLGSFLEDQSPPDLQVEALMALGRIASISNNHAQV